MNDGDTMPFQQTDAYKVAKDLAIAVHAAKIRDAELRDQAGRASKSAFLQTAEGLPNDSVPMRRKYFTCARNSVCETAAALDLALALDAVSDVPRARTAIHLAAKLRAILIGLLR